MHALQWQRGDTLVIEYNIVGFIFILVEAFSGCNNGFIRLAKPTLSPEDSSLVELARSDHSPPAESPPPPLLPSDTTPETTVSKKTTKRTTVPNPPLPTSRTPSPKRPNNPMPVVDGAEEEKGVQRAPLTLIDLGFLTEEERGTILEVLKRDEELRKSEEVRVNTKLKTELHELRKKAAVNTDDEKSNPNGCARCHEEFGLFSSGNQCPKCKHNVCPKCQVFTPTGKRWLCVVCHKAMQIKIESGEWFYEKLEVAEKVTLFGSDLVKASLAKAKGDPSNPPKLTIDDLRPSSSAESTPRTKHRVRHRRTNSNPKDLRNYRHADSASDRDSGWSQHNGASLDASESSQRSSLHEDESHQRSSRYGHKRGQYTQANMHGDARHRYPSPRWEVQREETESLSYSSSSSCDITTETESSYSRHSQGHSSLSQTESQGQMSPPPPQRQQMQVIASIHSSTTGSEHVNSDSEAEDTTEASTGFRFTRVSVKKTHMPSTPTRDVYGTSLEPTIEEQDHLVPAADTASIASGHTPQRSRAGSTAFTPQRSRSGSSAAPFAEGASNSKEHEPVGVEEVDARLHAELEQHPEILVHEAEPTKADEQLSREDEDIDRYLAAVTTTSSAAAAATTSTTGATRSLSLTPSSAHGDPSPEEQEADIPSEEQNGQRNGGPPTGPPTVEHGSLGRDTDGSYPSSVVSGVSLSEKGSDYSPDRSYTRHISPGDTTSVSMESSLARKLQRQERPYPLLSKGSSTSLTSLYSEAGENYGKFPITGDIQFGLSYNYKIGVFEIKVINCRDLAPTDIKKNKSDPYVKTYLLPDKTKNGKRKTKVKRGTINPMFEETIKYTISQSELQSRTLSVSVWNRDAFGRNTFLGEVLMSLDTVSLDNYKPQWHPLCNKAPPTEGTLSYKGDIVLALRFEPADVDSRVDTEEDVSSSPEKTSKKKKGKRKGSSPTKKSGGSLHINIKEAKNLMAVRMNGSSNPFVKCYLEPDRSKHGKRKTNVVKNNLNPSWNYQLCYSNVTLKSLKERCLELTVWDYDTIGSNDFLGGLRLGMGTGLSFGKEVDWMDSTPDEIRSWERMLQTPGEWVETTLTLRPNMNTKGNT